MRGTGTLRFAGTRRGLVFFEAVDCRDGIFSVTIFHGGGRSPRTLRAPNCTHRFRFALSERDWRRHSHRIVIRDCERPGGSFDSAWRVRRGEGRPFRVRSIVLET